MEKSKLGDELYVEHILEAIEKIEKFAAGLEFKNFQNDEKSQSAIVREISVIGEAAKNLSEEFKKSRPLIPWKDVMGMRDTLIHDYFEIDLDIVWGTIKENLPDLKQKISK